MEYESVSADKIKVDELVVGDNIQMGPNATISWDEKTNLHPDTDLLLRLQKIYHDYKHLC